MLTTTLPPKSCSLPPYSSKKVHRPSAPIHRPLGGDIAPVENHCSN